LQTIQLGTPSPFFGFWCGFRERKEPDPKLGMCLNKGNQQKRLAYEKKYKEKHGQESDPYNSSFDIDVTHLDLIHIAT
jgi:hypothetical protein